MVGVSPNCDGQYLEIRADAAATLEVKEKETMAEAKRLQNRVEGLQSAVQQLNKERTAFAGKYLKP